MPKSERCTKRIVFYLTPSEFKRGEKARKIHPGIRNANAYATSAYLLEVERDLRKALK